MYQYSDYPMQTKAQSKALEKRKETALSHKKHKH
jgi:hypothetical protein